jgi:hypothetical protein
MPMKSGFYRDTRRLPGALDARKARIDPEPPVASVRCAPLESELTRSCIATNENLSPWSHALTAACSSSRTLRLSRRNKNRIAPIGKDTEMIHGPKNSACDEALNSCSAKTVMPH